MNSLPSILAVVAMAFACPVCGGTDLHYCETEPTPRITGPSGYRRARRRLGYKARPPRETPRRGER